MELSEVCLISAAAVADAVNEQKDRTQRGGGGRALDAATAVLGTQADADVFGVLGEVRVKSARLSFVSPPILA